MRAHWIEIRLSCILVMRALLSTLNQVIDPIVLEFVRVWVEAFRLSDQLHLLVVVRGLTVGGYHGLLKVCVLEVGTGVLNHRLLRLLPLFASLTRLLRCGTICLHNGLTIVAKCPDSLLSL